MGQFAARGQTGVGKYQPEIYWTTPADTQKYLFIYHLKVIVIQVVRIQANVYDKLHLQRGRMGLKVRPKRQ